MTAALKDVRDTAEEFASKAERFVGWLDRATADESTTVDMRQLHELLGALQTAAARLPAVAPGEAAEPELEYKRCSESTLRSRLPMDAYSVVFNPFEYDPLEMNPPKPVMATLTDDLSDMHRDLMEGLVLYRADRFQDALWQWRFMYYAHWGRHLSHAQCAIWQYLSEGNRT